MTLNDKEQLKQHLIEHGTDNILDFTREKIFQKVDIQSLLYFLREDKLFTNNFVRAGTLALLTELNLSLSMRICTNGNFSQQSKKVNRLTEEIGFSLPVSYCSLIVPKPAPTCLLYSLGGIPPENVLFIGDSLVDILAADSAGIPFLNVSSLVGTE
jgi:phosphoglycolate phosphatase-like HAD superfamily hydrolase